MVEDMPIYDGCNETNNYDNVKCTKQAIQKYIIDFILPISPETIKHDLGRINIEFIVDIDGSVRSFSPLNSDSILNEKIVNKLMEMPKFTPGKQRNIPVKVKYKIPFYVRIE